MRLIDADALSKDVSWIDVNKPSDDKEDIIEKVLGFIDLQPTVEAKEVVHGKWIAQDETLTRFMCSNCEKKNYGGHERFCPYCGCDMRSSTE